MSGQVGARGANERCEQKNLSQRIMFAHAFQSGSKGVELVSPSGTEKGCSLLCQNVTRVYDRGIKGYLFQIARGHGGIQCPASAKDTLAITQALLVLQIQTGLDQKVTIEVVILDRHRLRHRLVLSSSFRHVESNQLHVQLPWAWSGVEPGTWCNLVLNMDDLTRRFFRVEFASLDSFCIKPVCQIRKVFTLPISALRQDMGIISVPPSFDFPSLVQNATVLYSANGLTGITRGTGLRGTPHLEQELGITGITLMCRREATAESGDIAFYNQNRAESRAGTEAQTKSPGEKQQQHPVSPVLVPLPSPPWLLTNSQSLQPRRQDPPALPPPQLSLPVVNCEGQGMIKASSLICVAKSRELREQEISIFPHPASVDSLLSRLAVATKRLRSAEMEYISEFG